MIPTSKIVGAVTEVSRSSGAAEQWISPLADAPPKGKNHFVLFLKPEVLAVDDGVKTAAIIDLVFGALRSRAVNTGAIRVLSSPGPPST